MIRQSVNMRHGYALNFGDAASREKYEQECEAARKAQRCRYAVSPRQVVKLHDGRVLIAGDEVRLEMFRADGDSPPWRAMEQLLLKGQVLEAYGFDGGSSAA